MEIRVLIVREGEWFVAQGLEVDIGTQARTLETLKQSFEMTFLAETAAREGRLDSIGPAPDEFWRAYDMEGAHRWVFNGGRDEQRTL